MKQSDHPLANYSAFLFDLNGTMIDDMHFHVRAWYRILNELGANISVEQTKKECYGKNHELLERVFPGRFTLEEKDRMSFEKEKQYQKEFAPVLRLTDGLEDFLKQSYNKGIKMAIGSAAIRFNIDFVLDGTNTRNYFDAIISADDVARSKPDPETWIRCAETLNVSPAECLVFEDAPKGVESAKNANMNAMVITTMHQPEEFSQYDNVIGFINDFTDISVVNLLKAV
jgi:HAD superfamily hydrolase (TIGR01509 family)